MFCTNCGSEIKGEAKFCSDCGKPKHDIKGTENGDVETMASKSIPANYEAKKQESELNKTMSKTLSALTLFIVSAVSYILSYLIGGIVGDGFGVLGFICLLLSIVRFITEIVNKKKQNK